MLKKRRKEAVACVLLVLLFAGLAWLSWNSRRPPLDSPEALLAHLQAAGLDYEGRRVEGAADEDLSKHQHHGFYLKRPSDHRTWHQLARTFLHNPAETMPGYLVVLPAAEPFGDPESDPGRARWGKLVLVGDPAEIERVLDALR